MDCKDTTFRFVFLKDPHFDLFGPASRKDNYLETLLQEMDQIAEICKKIDAKALIIAGDVFLRTDPYRIPYKLVTGMMDYFRRFPVPVCGIIGNHDAQTGLEHYEKYPISVLIKSGVYQFLDENPMIIEENGFKVKIGGVSYQKDPLSKLNAYKKGDEDYLIMVAHMFLAERPGDFFGERVYGIKEFDEAEFDILGVGHEHVNKGIYTRNGKTFINSGQVSRVSASEEDRNLEPKVVVFTVSSSPEKGCKFKEIPLSYKPADVIFGPEVEKEWKEDIVDWDNFVDKMEDILERNTIVDLSSLINETDYSNEAKEKARAYVME